MMNFFKTYKTRGEKTKKFNFNELQNKSIRKIIMKIKQHCLT